MRHPHRPSYDISLRPGGRPLPSVLLLGAHGGLTAADLRSAIIIFTLCRATAGPPLLRMFPVRCYCASGAGEGIPDTPIARLEMKLRERTTDRRSAGAGVFTNVSRTTNPGLGLLTGRATYFGLTEGVQLLSTMPGSYFGGKK